jgi:hypothetical protein
MNRLSPTVTDNIAEGATLRVVKIDSRSLKVSNLRRNLSLAFNERNAVGQRPVGFRSLYSPNG